MLIKLSFYFLPFALVALPFLLVVAQPDLGTSILNCIGRLTVSWLAGVSVKFFTYASILFISLTPIAIAFLKALSKIKDFNFFKSR